jgi:5-methylcytosine-specific restriction endonuclease McrA
MIPDDQSFLAPRRYMREPIKEIFEAAEILDRATDAHLSGNYTLAEALIKSADLPTVRAFTESLWGAKKANPDQWKYRRFRGIAGSPPFIRSSDKAKPTEGQKTCLVARDGCYCRFCGMPLIRVKVIEKFRSLYPDAAYWEGNKNQKQHAAFQCMWLQYDHVLPHSRGGATSLENLVVTCAPCNYGRSQWTLEEVGLLDPREFPRKSGSWDGLERILSSKTAKPQS